MHRGQSLYLDLLRLAAALEVFAFHLAGLPNTGVAHGLWNSFGHEAVTIFFVLSGFVIPYAAGSHDPDPRAFVVARLTRIYSVAIPCLILTFAFDWLGHIVDPSLYRGLSPPGSIAFRLTMGAMMLHESWQSVQMLSNTPYWSIAYEFWYYGLFSTLFYLTGKARILASVAVALVAGPNIVLLFPIWAAGWLAYRQRWTESWRSWVIWLAFVQPFVVFAIYHHFSLQRVSGQWLEVGLGHELWWKHLAWSRYLLTDTLLGCSVALNLAAAKHLGEPLERALSWLARPVKWGVARSFTLYLLHQPAIVVITALLAMSFSIELRGLAIAATTLLIIVAVAEVTEMRRAYLKPLVQRLVDLFWIGSANATTRSGTASVRR